MPFSKNINVKHLKTKCNTMKINLKDINYYFLTCNNLTRKTHILNEFKNYKLIEVNPIIGIGKNKSGATGFSKILDLACQNQPRTKPFQPFVILEDDVKKYREFPSEIEIPNDADILYIGLSTSGANETEKGNWYPVINNINDNIVRIYNMFSTHGIIICSVRGLLAIQKCMLESYFKDIVWDTFTTSIQPHLNVYALKKPLVYQYSVLGGWEEATKIEFTNIKDKVFLNKWINTDNVSIITNYDKNN